LKRVILLLLIGSTWLFGQMSHAQLSLELLKDLNNAIADTLDLSPDSLQLRFDESHIPAAYLAQIWAGHTGTPKADAPAFPVIGIEVRELNLGIARDPSAPSGNKPYLRRLDLNVIFGHVGKTHEWQGKTSDRMDSQGLAGLLNESFPTQIDGDYKAGEPPHLKIILLSLGLIGLFTALFFIRT
jgi:hypothetical protein